MVTVFAHKDPDAWETLTTAMIQAGLVVTASWPIDTEMQGPDLNEQGCTRDIAVDRLPKAARKR